MRITARIVLLALAAVFVFIAADLLHSPTGPRDATGISGPTVVRLPPGEGTAGPLLAYTGVSRGRGAWLLARPLDRDGKGAATQTVLEPPTVGGDQTGIYGAQFVAPDRLYYIVKSATPGALPSGTVHMARWSAGAWQVRPQPVLTATSGGIGWVSVLPPGPTGPEWRMWYVEAPGVQSRLGYATSHDGIAWERKPESAWQPDACTIETVSVLPWEGALRAWAVVYDPSTFSRSLVGFDIGPDGKPESGPEPVAWQAPELRFGNLPKNAIPIVDARAESGTADTRDVLLYITYRGTDGRSRITVAENFPVAGERSPTIFARQAKPLIEQGSDKWVGRTSPVIAPVLLLSALVLTAMAFRVGRRQSAGQDMEMEALNAESNSLQTPNGASGRPPERLE